MPAYQNLLVPTDFSEFSARAAARAADLAQSFGARLHVVHVVDYIPPSYARVELPEMLSSPEKMVERAREHLAGWVEEQGLEVADQRAVRDVVGLVGGVHGYSQLSSSWWYKGYPRSR